jgi:putative beta-lysine N-acetyltransferase
MNDYKGGMIMYDIVEVVGKGSVIQHGKHNNRVYLMKLDERDADIILEEISVLANKNKYSKLFCKLPKSLAPKFFANGYILEGYIPRFYKDLDDVFFVSKYLNSDRLLNIEVEQLSSLKQLFTEESDTNKKVRKDTSGYSVRKLLVSDVQRMTEIYSEVFESYPFPIHNQDYILKTMNENVQYFGVEKGDNLVALASSEVDGAGKNAEMTDFATLQSHAGKSLASLLLETMEREMKKQGIKTLYTIARLNSIAMNKTFLRFNYEYSGTLLKNTNISGTIESMNLYYKHL